MNANQIRKQTERDDKNAHYAARDLVLPYIAKVALATALEDPERCEELVAAAIATERHWAISDAVKAGLQIVEPVRDTEDGLVVVLASGQEWRLHTTLERIK